MNRSEDFTYPDAGITSVDCMSIILDAIDLSYAADRGVYVHCFGGMGQTARRFAAGF